MLSFSGVTFVLFCFVTTLCVLFRFCFFLFMVACSEYFCTISYRFIFVRRVRCTFFSVRIQSIILDGTAEPVSRDQILRLERGQGKIIFPIQLTTNIIGNLTLLILTFAICDGVFLPCDHGLDFIFYISLCENSNNQSINQSINQWRLIFGDTAFSEYFLYHFRFL